MGFKCAVRGVVQYICVTVDIWTGLASGIGAGA